MQPVREPYVPASPEVADRDGSIGKAKIPHQLEAKGERRLLRDKAIATEVGV